MRVLKQVAQMGAIALATIVLGIPSMVYLSDDAEARRTVSRSSYRVSKPAKIAYKPRSTTNKPAKTVYKQTTKKTVKKPLFNTFKSNNKQSSKHAKNSGFKQQTNRNVAVKNAWKKKQSKFKKKPVIVKTSNGTPAKTKNAVNTAYKKRYTKDPVYRRAQQYDRNTYDRRRQSYYSDYEPPSYVYNSSPSYGLWDTLFLYSMMSNMNNASSFAHNHQNDADYKQWRREADKQAQNNAELRAQLAQMDAKVSGLSSTPIDPGYLPKGVDADVAMSDTAVASQKPVFRACVGGTSGAYFFAVAGVMMPGITNVNIVPVPTAGTREIQDKIRTDQCDGGFLQSDAYWNFIERFQIDDIPFERVFSPITEKVHLVCNVDGPIHSADDMDKNTKLWFPAKSGAAETFTNWIAEDGDYGRVQTVLNNRSMIVASNEEAFLKIRSDKNACAMFVAAEGATSLMKKLDRTAKSMKMVLVEVTDGSFVDTEDPSGEDVYQFSELDNSIYPNLLRNGGCYGHCSGDITTVKLNGDFVVSKKWKQDNAKIYPDFAFSLVMMEDEIKRTIKARANL